MKPEDLKDRMISIRVNEPYDWKQGIVTGQIIDIKDNKLIISLTKTLRGQKFRSNTMIIQPRYQDDNFDTLIKKRLLTVGGALIKDNSDETDYLLIGDLTL
jgi:hypothetical protein